MIWLFAAVLLVLAALSPGFRRLGLGIAGLAILIIVGLILLNDRDKKPSPPLAEATPTPPVRQKMMDHDEYVLSTQDKRDPDAARRIALEEVRFGEVVAADAPLQSGPSPSPAEFRSIQARLYNDSPRFTLTHYSYDLTIQDCVANRCTTVFEQRHRGVPVTVPPRQARDVVIPLLPASRSEAPAFKLIGEARLRLDCTETRAYQTPDGLQPFDPATASVSGAK